MGKQKQKELTLEEKKDYIRKHLNKSYIDIINDAKKEALKKLYELSNHPNPAISLRACSDILRYSKIENEENEDDNGISFEGWLKKNNNAE